MKMVWFHSECIYDFRVQFLSDIVTDWEEAIVGLMIANISLFEEKREQTNSTFLSVSVLVKRKGGSVFTYI